MTSAYSEYESFVAGLLRTLGSGRFAASVHGGANHRIPGASGVRHQVDASFIDDTAVPPSLVLVECKHLTEAIKLSHVKILKATLDDIASAEPTRKVVGFLVSWRGAQRGATVYAQHYGVSLIQVDPHSEYDFAYQRWCVSARSASSHGGGYAVAEACAVRRCITCGRVFSTQANATTCENCVPVRNAA